MNKLEVIQALCEQNGISKLEATKIVSIFIEQMAAALKGGDRVEIRGLCSFYVKDYPGYAGRNPKTGERVTPRDIIRNIPGVNLVAAERQKRTSFCCGAGGGHMWMKESAGQEINAERLDELYKTGAKTVATACPYCMIMLDDAVKEKELEEEIKVVDLAQMMLTSIEG